MPELEERCGERRECRCSGLDGGARSDLSGCEWDLDLCKGKKSKENKTRGLVAFTTEPILNHPIIIVRPKNMCAQALPRLQAAHHTRNEEVTWQ